MQKEAAVCSTQTAASLFVFFKGTKPSVSFHRKETKCASLCAAVQQRSPALFFQQPHLHFRLPPIGKRIIGDQRQRKRRI